MSGSLSYIPSGDAAFIIKVGEGISRENHNRVRMIYDQIAKASIPSIIECIPSYNEILINYNATIINYKEILAELKLLANSASNAERIPSKIIEVPVLYGGKSGPDLEFVAKHANLTKEKVIEYHSKPDYLVYMLGFTPGFCYLGGLDSKIETPRLEHPRTEIPRGSVGIANDQTGIYPIDSPGGWQIIGKTPLVLFDPEQKPEFLFESGNYLRFIPVNNEQYCQIEEEVMNGSYELNIIMKDS
jgi:KipI family sensor histidine kinase inhibitor